MATGYFISVEIETANGVFYRKGAEMFSATDKIPVGLGVLTYPDRRVKKFRLYAQVLTTPKSGTWYYKEFNASPSEMCNFASAWIRQELDTVTYVEAWTPALTYVPRYAVANRVIDATLFITSGTEILWSEIYTLYVINRATEGDPNRVLVSTTYKPRQLLGRNAHSIGNSADDEVRTFMANAKAISAGQFGQFPLYAFCKNSIWAMEVGDVAFKRISPVSVNEGVISKHTVANVDAMVIYATRDGVKAISESEVRLLSSDIQNSDTYNCDDILRNLDEHTRFAVFVDKNSGRKELWVSTPGGIFCFSFEMKRWFRLSGTREFFFEVNGILIGGYDGVLQKEAGPTARIGNFQTAPISFGEPEVMKKFRRIILRKGGTDHGYEVIATNHTDYDFTLTNSAIDRPVYTTDEAGVKTPLYSLAEVGITHPIYSIDVEFEARYTHRMRLRRTDIDLGLYGGYGGIYARLYCDILAPTQIAINAGDNQSEAAGSILTVAPSVIVKDVYDYPVADVPVDFEVVSGDGEVTASSATTNANGIARVGSWTLGVVTGVNTLSASAVGLTGSPVTFTATGT